MIWRGLLAKLYMSLDSSWWAQRSNPSWGIWFGGECLPNHMYWAQISGEVKAIPSWWIQFGGECLTNCMCWAQISGEGKAIPSWWIQFEGECLPNCMWGQTRNNWAPKQPKLGDTIWRRVLAKLYVSSTPKFGELKTTQFGRYDLVGSACQIVCAELK